MTQYIAQRKDDRMRRKAIVTTAAVVSVITLGLAGCAGEKQATSAQTEQTVAQEATAAAEQETEAAGNGSADASANTSTEGESALNADDVIFAGMDETQVSEIKASLEEILQKNQFGLVYDGAITENVSGEVNIRPVFYETQQNIKIAANLYLPADYDAEGSFPAIVVAHPNGGVKEQVAGLFAQRLAENGYITIAYDAAYQGASGGTPRQTDCPTNRVEDIRASIDYLMTVQGVDPARIGTLGICGGGGYVIQTSKTDKRIQAVATISMFNTGRVRRNGFQDSDIAGAQDRLDRAAEARNKYLETGEVDYVSSLVTKRREFTQEQLEQMPAGLYRDGAEYYGSTHYHPYSQGRYTTMSLMDLMAFDAEDQAELIDQPLLMMVGDVSDTRYMTEGVFEKATGTEDKKLVLIPGATHIETYWKPEYVEQELNELVDFFGTKLAE